MTHKEVVAHAERWMKSQNYRLIISEHPTTLEEEPDCIGWKWGFSTLIECKTTRADFLSDKNKPFRKKPELGMGYTRYYMCPIGLIKQEELPEKWGLLYINGKQIKIVKKPHEIDDLFTERDLESEVALLVSYIAKLKKAGMVVQ